ncbi:MAG: PD-(D/E)XK nuclease family protein [bacterium]|nr:PD-(D/E)XK nuclease family protein [bacterium]
MTTPHVAPLAPCAPNVPLLNPQIPEGFTVHNDHWSFSRLDAYARCPLAYKARYLDPKIYGADCVKPIPSITSPAELGTLCHKALELAGHVLLKARFKGRINRHQKLMLECLTQAFKEQPTASGQILADAQAILIEYLKAGDFYADQIIGLEWPFELVLEEPDGDILLIGFIDRLEVTPEGVVRIKDYKTNRLYYTKDELRQSLQPSIYEIAIRESEALAVTPETPVDFEFVLLRHGVSQRTTRSASDLDRALHQIVTLVRRCENSTHFKPMLNKYCAYCDHKTRCPLWKEIVARGLPEAHIDPNDLAAIAVEYERASDAAKILYRQKEELADLMKIHLIGHDQIETPTHLFRASANNETTFLDPHQVVSLLAQAYRRTIPEVMRRIGRISKTEFDLVMKDAQGRLTVTAFKELQAEIAPLIETMPNPKLQAYKQPVEDTELKPTRVKRPKAKRRIRV